MATIDDFGGATDPLNAPPLGGPTGWAAAVRDFITGLPADIADLAADIADLAADIAANTSAIAGKVSKTGDTMTGALTVPDPTAADHAATKGYVDSRVRFGRQLPGAAGAGDDGQQFAVVFNPPFASIPSVVATTYSDAPNGAAGCFASISALTVNGCTIHRFNSSSAAKTFGVLWQATGDVS